VTPLRTLEDVKRRAQRHAIRTTPTRCPWGPALLLTPCPCCGDGSAIAEHDGLGLIPYCMTCGGDVAAALEREPGLDQEAIIDLLLDLVLTLVRELAAQDERREAA
jgi:hypothetical protein